MKIFRTIAAFVVGGITASSFLVVVIPPAQASQLDFVRTEKKIESAVPVQSAPIEQEPVVYVATSSIEKKIEVYAKKYGQSAALMRELVSCETAGTFDPNIQSDAIYTFSDPARGIVKGQRERSFGLSQIHLLDNPGITEEQAKDPDFALDFMARELAMGNTWRWKLCYHGAHQ